MNKYSTVCNKYRYILIIYWGINDEKRNLITVAMLAGMVSGMAMADNHSVSLGYAQSKIQHSDIKLKGVNLQYRYEFDSPVSVLASFSYMKGDESGTENEDGANFKYNTDVKYYSLLVGPAYRVNDYVSLYAAGGFAHTKVDANGTLKYNGMTSSDSESESYTDFAYGAGVIVQPIDNFTVTLGYEGTKVEGSKFNGFNIGLGYRF